MARPWPSAANWWRCLAKAAIPPHAVTECGNCGAALTGPYCSSCGQHAHESARSVAVLLHDAWHLATHVDARFWQTAANLLLRPGHLTQEYFADRRARYLPPVRVYLVLSVLFFGFGTLTGTSYNQAKQPTTRSVTTDGVAVHALMVGFTYSIALALTLVVTLIISAVVG
jgi:hypothetical protein